MSYQYFGQKLLQFMHILRLGGYEVNCHGYSFMNIMMLIHMFHGPDITVMRTKYYLYLSSKQWRVSNIIQR